MILDYIKTWPQYLIPHHLLTRLMGWLASREQAWLKNVAIRLFVRFYKVDMSEAVEENPLNYATFNDFFIRHLKPETRPLAEQANTILSPADGTISQLASIESGGRLLQAKGHYFSLHELLGGDVEHTELFSNGYFATIYLAPKDYHRVHMPYKGQLKVMRYLPGKLFSVNDSAANVIPQLFSRNERVVCLFETDLGPMAVILVGAMNVGSIHTVWHGAVTPPHNSKPHLWRYPNPKTEAVTLNAGDELGHFQLGSTVIILFPEKSMQWQETLTAQQSIKMGQLLGKLSS